MTYPSPEEFERHKRRLDRLRPFAQIAAALIFIATAFALFVAIFGV